MASVEDNLKFPKTRKKLTPSNCTAGLDVVSTDNWMTSSYSNVDTERSSLIFAVVTH